MSGLSFLGKVSLDSCPKGGSFSQGVYSEFLSIPFFISHKSPVAPSHFSQSWNSMTCSAFLGKPDMNIKKYILLSVSKSNMVWTIKQDHHYTSWIPHASISDWARRGIAMFYGKTYSCFFHLPVFKVLLLLAKHQAAFSQKQRVRFL